jgi:DNA-binding NarL/FixJ family response regulator
MQIATHNIAIIEDNKSIRNGVSTYIGFQEDMELVFATDSVEAFLRIIDKPTTEYPDVLLLDIGLPGISGVEGIPYILEQLPELDIIMLTTYEEESVILKAICAGACSYLSKRASLDEIIEAIRIVKKGGSYMSPVIAREIVQYLMGGQISKATMLTERQKSVLKELVKGKTYTAIAKEMQLSPETVKSHIKRMYKALHINSKAEAIAMYLRGEIK